VRPNLFYECKGAKNQVDNGDVTEEEPQWNDVGRGLHSSTFRLNVSTFCWIRWVHDFPPVY